MYAKKKIYKTKVVILIIIMLVGILIHSTVLWTLNRLLPLETLASTTAENLSNAKMRLFIRSIAEVANGVCSTVFFIGNIVMIYLFIKKSPAVSFYKLFVAFFALIAAMFICVSPFAISDKTFWADYLFPLWSDLVVITVLFLIVLILNSIKRCKNKKLVS